MGWAAGRRYDVRVCWGCRAWRGPETGPASTPGFRAEQEFQAGVQQGAVGYHVVDLIGALAASAAGQASLMDALAGSLVPAAETASTPQSLALLRVYAAVGSPALRPAAEQDRRRTGR